MTYQDFLFSSEAVKLLRQVVSDANELVGELHFCVVWIVCRDRRISLERQEAEPDIIDNAGSECLDTPEPLPADGSDDIVRRRASDTADIMVAGNPEHLDSLRFQLLEQAGNHQNLICRRARICEKVARGNNEFRAFLQT